ncbi:MAG: PTS lactose/cellobiose transporter subunit IIA [Mycoplasmoidaceae bacterium]|nr:PTS lactose/cellobiose transporter subunit IIA [Mycoplasmoidaceae bacterium]
MAQTNKATEIGFEIVALAGDARSIYLECLQNLKESSANDSEAVIEKVRASMKEAEDLLNECHVKQTDMLQDEARGIDQPHSYLMVHAQDHLMTTILLKELLESFIDLYSKVK